MLMIALAWIITILIISKNSEDRSYRLWAFIRMCILLALSIGFIAYGLAFMSVFTGIGVIFAFAKIFIGKRNCKSEVINDM